MQSIILRSACVCIHHQRDFNCHHHESVFSLHVPKATQAFFPQRRWWHKLAHLPCLPQQPAHLSWRVDGWHTRKQNAWRQRRTLVFLQLRSSSRVFGQRHQHHRHWHKPKINPSFGQIFTHSYKPNELSFICIALAIHINQALIRSWWWFCHR